jgi:hypothetical protein
MFRDVVDSKRRWSSPSLACSSMRFDDCFQEEEGVGQKRASPSAECQPKLSAEKEGGHVGLDFYDFLIEASLPLALLGFRQTPDLLEILGVTLSTE